MNPYNASKHQKLQWITDGKYLNLLINDKSKWIEIAARKRNIEFQKEKYLQDVENIKSSMDADLFDVIVISSKTDDEVYELIQDNKFLTYFAECDNLGYRLRAKRRLKEYLENLSVTEDVYGNSM